MAVFHIAGRGDFPWERDKVTLSEGIAMEQATGKLFDELVLLYNAKRRLGAAAFAWLAMRRNGVRVAFTEFADGLQVGDIQETFEDETPVDEPAGEESTPADPPAGAAAKPAAQKRPPASARKKAGSPRK